MATTAVAEGTTNAQAGAGETQQPAEGTSTAAAGTTQPGAAGAAAAGTGTAGAGKAGETATELTTNADGTTQPGSTKGTTAEPKPATGAPEKYTLQAEEGREAYVTPAVLARLESQARANNWTNERAQDALDEYTDQVHAQMESWQAQVKADPEFGGEKVERTMNTANRVIDRVYPAGHPRRDGFLAFLKDTATLNRVEAVAFLATLGGMLGEDKGITGKAAGGSGQSDADIFYDNPTSIKANEEGKATWGRT